MKKSKQILATICCILFFILTIPNVNALAASSSSTVTVPSILQANTKWCWAASATMAGRNAYPNTSIDQYDVYEYIKGNRNTNYAGTESEIIRGAQYASLNTHTYYLSSISFSNISNSINAGYAPITVSTSSSSGSRHAMVIYGVSTVTGTDVAIFVSFIDPWTGSRYTYEYSAFCNGSYSNLVLNSTIRTS